ncbi:hypothetical protein PGT21_024018 [Puccinia graminis f. sp. tritici]|uniref:Uncharacterized protein n=1 Tax=Puccinia graminis f. sp. tritici TaxID=56615 RepID=A0A5B0MS06_PUCGR|nr:hypothetical protein PGT21_024018 [Puccinia graminis f. sp. tritici]
MPSPDQQDPSLSGSPEQPPNEPVDEAEVELYGGGDDPEREALLAGHARILERKPTSVELRLAILAFFSLCAASIGFGLFAGELVKFHRAHPPDNGHPPVKIVTTTVFLSPTNAPSPPKNPNNVCASGPCVDAAAELRRTTQLSVDPCEDFAKFSTAGLRPAAREMISARVDSTIEHVLSGPTSPNPTLRKIQAFKSLCEREGSRPTYSEYSILLDEVTRLWMRKTGSEANRIGAVLAYLHAASLPALFKMTVTSGRSRVVPQTISVEGLAEAFEAIYPANQVSQRVWGVQRFAATLSRLAADQEPGESGRLTVDQLQALSCPSPSLPCWIRWKDFYSALDPAQPLGLLTVHGLNYFAHIARAIAEQSEIGLESYFHWVIVLSMRRQDCQQETKLAFGPSLLQHLFLNTPDQLSDLHAHLRSARFILDSMSKRAIHSKLPRTIEGPPTESDQHTELSAIRSDSWVQTVYGLERIKTRREFSERRLRWNVLDTQPMIVEDRLYLPFGALQIMYPSFVDLPKSLIFGTFGYMMYDLLRKMESNSSMTLDEVSEEFEFYQQLHINRAF